MKITKYGTVTISEDGVKVSDFTFDAEGAELTQAECAIAACLWAIESVEKELVSVKIVDGGGNTRNGQPV